MTHQDLTPFSVSAPLAHEAVFTIASPTKAATHELEARLRDLELRYAELQARFADTAR